MDMYPLVPCASEAQSQSQKSLKIKKMMPVFFSDVARSLNRIPIDAGRNGKLP